MKPTKSALSGTKDVHKTNAFRRILAQVVATSIKNLLLFDLGLCISLPTVIIPALTGLPNDHNRDEFLSITPAQASWIGSLGYLVQPIFACLSALMTDPLGRKRSMILVNIPFALGWYLLWRATEIWEIFCGFAMLGAAIGLMEAAIITYLGEICEPSTRGILIAYTSISVTFGMFSIFFLNTLMAWRTISMVCLSVPVITAIAICFIPETPQWLLAKNRVDEAEKSLCWLRGWVSREAVAQEFNDLKRHSERSKSCNLCIKQNIKCSHPLPTFVEKLSELKRKRTLKPFIIIMVLFFLAQFTGVHAMRPFIVQIFKAYESPIPPDEAAAVMSFADNIANIVFMCFVRLSGKRRIYLTMTFGVFLCSLIISCYGFIFLPNGYVSFDQLHQTFHLENKDLSYIPTICLFLWSFCSFCGFSAMPWMFLSELFPFKSRGVASGIAAALNYVIGFVSRKTYYNLETTMSLPGISMFYCVITVCGLIFAWIVLPETENRTLEDIELHFSDNSKKFTDRKIIKSKSARKNANDTGKPTVKSDEQLGGNGFEAGFDNKAFESECTKV